MQYYCHLQVNKLNSRHLNPIYIDRYNLLVQLGLGEQLREILHLHCKLVKLVNPTTLLHNLVRENQHRMNKNYLERQFALIHQYRDEFDWGVEHLIQMGFVNQNVLG